MGSLPSSAPPTLPLIDISPFLNPSSSSASSRQSTVSALSSACSAYGFFYLTGHGIPSSTTSTILSHARRFFQECAPQEKARIKRRDPGEFLGDGARGYQVTGENVTKGKRDWHEGVDWYREMAEGEEGLEAEDLQADSGGADDGAWVLRPGAKTLEARRPPFRLLEGVNLWPSHPADFREVYTRYIADMQRVGTAVLRALGEALELRDPDTFVRATRKSFWVMRAIGYPSLDPDLAAQGGVSCGEHTDYGCLTLLLADETKGALQVLHRRSDGTEEWVSADPIEGAYVVNVGDMVELWTNGLVKSTLHRVVHTGQNYRVSVPFFFEPDRDAVVEPLEECVERTGGIRKGEKVMYGDHLAVKVGGNFYGGGTSN